MKGRYSRKRLVILAVFWIGIGVFFTGGSLLAGVGADPNCNSAPAPCDFPAENYDGGIILGTPALDGSQLVFFDPDTADSVANYEGITNSYTSSGQRDIGSADTLPPGAESNSIDVATIGFNVDQLNQGLFLYKTWKTTSDRNPPTQTEVNNRDYQNVNVWIQGAQATLNGPSGEVNNVNCKEDYQDEFNPNHCDLTAELSEVSFNNVELEAQVTADAAIIGTDQYDINGGTIDGLSPSPEDSYWVIRPEDDTCSVGLNVLNLGFSFGSGLNIDLTAFCLSFVDPTFPDQEASNLNIGPIQAATVDDFQIETLVLKDLIVKGPSFFAERPTGPAAQDAVSQGADSQDLNKNLVLGEKNRPDDASEPGFYAEIRWGKGHDRALFPDSNPDLTGDRSRFGGPAPEDSNIETDSTRYSGLANPYPCEGNPTGIGSQNCNRNTDNQGAPEPGPYDDIYRP